ncbi:MAG: RNA ligase family protein [Candidatus Sumerlaeota bacterium]|nr:RNA ligase family protein [Candidatus Sumerlaeota bacterium]
MKALLSKSDGKAMAREEDAAPEPRDIPIIKYPRTPHLEGSEIQVGDHDMPLIAFAEIEGRHIVASEKLDGANCGVSFTKQGRLILQSRGHELRGGRREAQFDLFKVWAASNREALWEFIGARFILYGEWLYAKHRIFYDRLPRHIITLDLFDKVEGIFLDDASRKEMTPSGDTIVHAPTLWEGRATRCEEITGLITHSRFISADPRKAFARACRKAGVDSDKASRETDLSGIMEGVYIKVEENGAVQGRYKYVRRSFIAGGGDEDTKWHNRPIIPNCLDRI